jgi:hypothetical protein
MNEYRIKSLATTLEVIEQLGSIFEKIARRNGVNLETIFFNVELWNTWVMLAVHISWIAAS